MSTATDEDYTEFLGRLAAAIGLDALTPDEDGLVTLTFNESNGVSFYFDEGDRSIRFFVETMLLPADTPATVYRDLLIGTLFGQETAGGWFSMEPEEGTLIYNYALRFDPSQAEPAQVAELIGNILDLSDAWRERIVAVITDAMTQTDAPAEDTPTAENTVPGTNMFAIRP